MRKSHERPSSGAPPAGGCYSDFVLSGPADSRLEMDKRRGEATPASSLKTRWRERLSETLREKWELVLIRAKREHWGEIPGSSPPKVSKRLKFSGNREDPRFKKISQL